MSRLTPTQSASMLEVQSSLERREMVLLRGKSDGKTRIAHEMQEMIATRTPEGKIRTERRHEENSQIEFITLSFPRENPLSSAKRQIITYVDGKAPRDATPVHLRLLAILRELHSQNKMLCVVVDNAELLDHRALTVIKALNEFRDLKERRDIGLAALISGSFVKMQRLLTRNGRDTSFLKHCKEIRVGRITSAEIGELISNQYPAEAMRFEEKALSRIAQLETTLDIHATVRKSIQLRKERRLTSIDIKCVEGALV